MYKLLLDRRGSVEAEMNEASSSSHIHSASASSPPTSRTSTPYTQAILPSPFIPPSLLDPTRQAPSLSSDLPPLPENVTPVEVAEQDTQTPDKWIKRNPELIRLTGKHPFNTEARLASLFNAGFLTPAHLHYVRNHGAVPQVMPDQLPNWKVRVHGLVEREIDFTLQDLCDTFQVVTLPVTLVCAGNRRKEQNVVKKSLGFNWGSAGLSTALWTGVYLSDILAYVKPRRGAKHVIFEGADTLPNGPYGTSQLLSWARNKDKGMLIAWAMNGLPLEPDHGFPVRLVVPGQIGGRSVKWLRRIEISERESQHHLHFRDNKVLPTQVTPDQARAEDHWWYDPRYIITDLNVNSAVAKPDHDEILHVQHSSPDSEAEQEYGVRGYAYAGGGRRVTRVEVSLDEGETWRLADIEYPEDKFREIYHSDPVYGTLDLLDRDTSFCWCFWTFKVPCILLSNSDAIMVRAMDEALALQPRDMYWSALGMMNNWWFRVAIHRTEKEDGTILRFEHPAPVGIEGGWIERMKASGEDFLKPAFGHKNSASEASPSAVPLTEEVQMTQPGVTRTITTEELKSQPKERPWFVVNGEVYDGTGFLEKHPGGGDSILLVAGEDASEDFMAIHSPDGRRKLAKFHIGTLVDRPGSTSTETVTGDCSSGEFLERKKWKAVKLVEKTRINHDSYLYKFALPEVDQPLGLPVGQHVFIRLKSRSNGMMVQRAYTPVSHEGTRGFIDLLIKLYLPTPEFPMGGKMTTEFARLEVGDSVELKGPLGSFVWLGNGKLSWKGTERSVRNVGMVCAGSGITPILQVLRSILHSDEDTKVWVISSNRTEADILCREELDALEKAHGERRFILFYTLSRHPDSWDFGKGRITDEMVAMYLPRPSEDGIILTCGPDRMIEETIKPALKRSGWDIEKSLVVF